MNKIARTQNNCVIKKKVQIFSVQVGFQPIFSQSMPISTPQNQVNVYYPIVLAFYDLHFGFYGEI